MKSFASNADEPLPSFWIGARVHRPGDDGGLPHPNASPSGASNHAVNRFNAAATWERRERVTDGLLAVIFVAGCALMGWAGASWL